VRNRPICGLWTKLHLFKDAVPSICFERFLNPLPKYMPVPTLMEICLNVAADCGRVGSEQFGFPDMFAGQDAADGVCPAPFGEQPAPPQMLHIIDAFLLLLKTRQTHE